jgi:CDP-glucose 4,6-dehydratase
MESLVTVHPPRPAAALPREAFWTGKRVLLTGHTGFKGSWLALWLQHLGATVVGVALAPPSTPSLFMRGRVAEGMTSIHGDVRHLDVLEDIMDTHRPEVVFHLAAQSLVRPSYRDPVTTYATNVMGTVHVLEAMRRTGTARVGVMVTSDKCYANRESMLWGYREDDPMGGHDPYSNSKGCAELVTSAYRDSFFTAGGDGQPSPAIASVRAGNVIGGGDWADDRLLPDIVRAFEAGTPVRIRRPQAIRPWQHVVEPLGGYLTLAQHLWKCGEAAGGGWNFGPNDDDARSVQYVAETMARAWGTGASVELDAGPHPHEATYLRLDCSKARTLLDWRPRLTLDEALAWTVDWYQSVDAGTDPRALTIDHIRQYEHLLQTAPAHDLH